ncbi:MAG: Fic family protein [Clostridiales bacterium]|nr:Fic family protein [Clostridiales bacterium]
MRNYDYTKKWEKLLTPNIVGLMTQIHEFKGRQDASIKPDTLEHLVEIARIQSTEASNRIEGIYTSEERLKKLVLDKTTPANRGEQEIAGYRDVLNTIHESYEHIPVKPNIILQLHKDLYKFSGLAVGGKYKSSDNVIAETDLEGNTKVRFAPVSAWETPQAIEELCRAYNDAIAAGKINPLLLIPMFVIDFLCIHPFTDGNGRMARLLTLLLLYRSGYQIGKYISIEKIVEKSKETYYDTLQQSSAGWHEEENNYAYFVEYTLGTILKAYREFEERTELIRSDEYSKPNRVREVIRERFGEITKSEIVDLCPDVSQTTIQRTLKELQESGEIIKIGGGRYTSYIWNREND